MTDRLAAPAELTSLAQELFGPNLPLAERYARLLQTTGAEQGLIGPREVDRIWERHLINCALMQEELGPVGTVGTLADVGSGAGLPGLVLALARPDIEVTLIETMQRRVTWLEETLEDLAAFADTWVDASAAHADAAAPVQFPSVTVIRSRAEELHGQLRFDVVTARAVAALDKLAKWTLPLARVGGRLVLLKGQSAPEEIKKAAPVLKRLGGRDARISVIHRDGIEVPTRVVTVDVTERPAKKGSRGGK